ncbi:sugar ABC transporter substrate-binding protein [candidate division KSB1 bacterium]|nr:sugar ABC transporter substrate-binding protein [candidate division KSB1 bacterium]
MLRKKRNIVLAVCVVLGITACSDEQVLTLRIANWADHNEAKIVDSVLREFEQANPGVKVVQESYVNQYREKILTSFAAGTAPDVLLLEAGYVPAFVNRNLLLDLNPYMERVGFDPQDYFPNVLAIAQRGGGLYAFPKDFTPLVVYYNRKVLRASGLPDPHPGWTWDDFVDMARHISRTGGQDGELDRYGAFFLRQFYLYQPFIWLNGGDVLSPDGMRATGYLTSPETVATMQWLIDWHKKYHFTAPLEITRNPSHRDRNIFYLGRAGFMISGHWWLPELRKYMQKRNLDIGIIGLPRVQGKPYVNVMYESGWAVSINSQHRKYAVKLAAHMAGELAQRRTARRGLAIPAMKRVAEENAAADSTGYEQIFLQEVANARLPWGNRIEDFTTIEDLANQIFDRTIWGNEALETVVTDIAQQIDALLKERASQRRE